MFKKSVWLALMVLTVASMVLASCNTTPTQTSTPATTPAGGQATPTVAKTTTPAAASPTATNLVKDSLGRMGEKPLYGGKITLAIQEPMTYISPLMGGSNATILYHFVSDELLTQDFSRGPSGTGEHSAVWVNWAGGLGMGIEIPMVADKVEILTPTKMSYHIRKGIKWQNVAPMNGRELTPADVVWNVKQYWTVPTASGTRGNYPYLKDMANLDNSVYIDPTDPQTVIVESMPGWLGQIFEKTGDYMELLPPEVGSGPDGVKPFNEAKGVIGTGPFILKDYVSGSKASFVKNPDYWGKDALHPENKLPYVDEVELLWMSDQAARLASLRTGKIDWAGATNTASTGWIRYEDAKSLQKTNPDLKYKQYNPGKSDAIALRYDIKPYNDVRVRRALMYAVNHEEILQKYYGGFGQLYQWPIINADVYKEMFWSLDQLPQETAWTLSGYHVDEAKALLAQAGLASGFKAQIDTWGTNPDWISIIKEYWAKIGVDLQINVLDAGVFNSVNTKHTSPELISAGLEGTVPFLFLVTKVNATTGIADNAAMVNIPELNQARLDVSANYFDSKKAKEIRRAVVPIELGAAVYLQMPAPDVWTFWWPWLKQYNGEIITGYCDPYNFPIWAWVDQDLKKKMGY